MLNNLTALSQLFTVPAVISPISILSLSWDRRAMIFFSAAEGLSLANSTKSSGDILILFRKPSSFLSYGSLVAGLLIAAENNSKLSPLSKDLSILAALNFSLIRN